MARYFCLPRWSGSGLHAASADDTVQFIPSSSAIDIGSIIVKSEGFDLSNKDRFYFDLLPTAAGRQGMSKTITLQFYWHDDLNEVIALDEQSGWAMDTWNCRIFDYPALRRYHRSGASVAAAAILLQSQGDCPKFVVERVPKLAKPSSLK